MSIRCTKEFSLKVANPFWNQVNWYFQSWTPGGTKPPDGGITEAFRERFSFYVKAKTTTLPDTSTGIVHCWCKIQVNNPGAPINCNLHLVVTDSTPFQTSNTGVTGEVNSSLVFSTPSGFLAAGTYDFPWTIPGFSLSLTEIRLNLQATSTSGSPVRAGAYWSGELQLL
jgi:hypothetical protein